MPNSLKTSAALLFSQILQIKHKATTLNSLDSPYHGHRYYPRDPKIESSNQSSLVVKQSNNVNCFPMLLAHMAPACYELYFVMRFSTESLQLKEAVNTKRHLRLGFQPSTLFHMNVRLHVYFIFFWMPLFFTQCFFDFYIKVLPKSQLVIFSI